MTTIAHSSVNGKQECVLKTGIFDNSAGMFLRFIFDLFTSARRVAGSRSRFASLSFLSMEGLKKRKTNWTEEEETVLIEEVNRRENILFGPLKGSGQSNKRKILEWQGVTDILNSSSCHIMAHMSSLSKRKRQTLNGQRTYEEVKKKYANVKQRAKTKLDAIKRPKTGGGGKLPSPSIPEKLLLDHLGGRPGMEGIYGGIDTSDSTIEVQQLPIEENYRNEDSEEDITNGTESMKTAVDNQTSEVLKKKNKKRKRINRQMEIEEMEVELLKMEKEKLALEIVNLKEKNEILGLKKQLLKRQMDQFDIATILEM